jgi:beta-glucosidase
MKKYDEALRLAAQLPTVVTVYLDRPAILTPLKGKVRALLANFGVSDAALLDVLGGHGAPQGKLPFDLPASMDGVTSQKSDVAHDLPHPLYRFGYGRKY